MPTGGADAGRAALHPRRRLVGGIVVAVVGLDQATKIWASDALAGSPVHLIDNTVEFRLAHNTGSAFSLFQTVTPALAVLGVVVAVILVRAMRRTDDRWVLVSLALVLGGAIGNAADRLFRAPGLLRGAVVDFIRLDGWPTFNVADSAITVGAVLLAAWSLFGGRRHPAAE